MRGHHGLQQAISQAVVAPINQSLPALGAKQRKLLQPILVRLERHILVVRGDREELPHMSGYGVEDRIRLVGARSCIMRKERGPQILPAFPFQ